MQKNESKHHMVRVQQDTIRKSCKDSRMPNVIHVEQRNGTAKQLESTLRAIAFPRTDSPLGPPPRQRGREGKAGCPVDYCLNVLPAPALQMHVLRSWLVLQPVPLPAAKARALKPQTRIKRHPDQRNPPGTLLHNTCPASLWQHCCALFLQSLLWRPCLIRKACVARHGT